jgi:hypothetical protein
MIFLGEERKSIRNQERGKRTAETWKNRKVREKSRK